MAQETYDVEILEKNSIWGGIAKTRVIGDAVYHPIGGHCFNSKHPEVLKFVFEKVLSKDQWHLVDRDAVIKLRDQEISYPIEYSIKEINKIAPDLIVLAGFLWMFPNSIIKEYPNKVINIHPALLPKYGGKGMYGKFVHEAVLDNKETETGITIHYVNEHYDEGEFIFQKAVNIKNCKTSDEIAGKVHQLEQIYFPKVVEELLSKK